MTPFNSVTTLVLFMLSIGITIVSTASTASTSNPSAIANAATTATNNKPGALAKATFAGGCFWCMEGPFDKLAGVVSTTSGYIGGSKIDPTYEEISGGRTGHTEAVEVVYDPKKVSYDTLLYVFWRNIDPFTKNRQFCDGGTQYRSGIFTHDAAQKDAAETSKTQLEKNPQFSGKIVTEITPASTFYPAEEYHQDYYQKNPIRYAYYRNGCGRDNRLKAIWGDAAGGALKAEAKK